MDTLISLYKSDPLLFRLQVKLFKSTISHPKFSFVYKPIPLLPSITNSEDIKNLVNKYKKINYKIFDSVETDEELELNLGTELYLLLTHIVKLNYFATRTLKQICWDDLLGQTQTQFKLLVDTNSMCQEDSTHIVAFDYSGSQEEKFSNPYWLFHGSGLYSWHYILKYGLKVMSRTPGQINGAAYGPGIYMSDDYQTAWSYSRVSFPTTNLKVVGVFQIAKEPSTYRKAHGIFVIPSDTDILLRYLIITKTTTWNYQMTQIVKQIMEKIGPGSSKICSQITNKRLQVEHKLLETNPLVEAIDIISQDKIWFIKLKTGLEIQMIFNKYPVVPPSISINKVELNLPITNPATWSINIKLGDIIKQINM